MHLLKSHNPYPDCLSIKLETVPTNTDTEQFDLYCSMNFNQQWLPLLDGRVKFGLKGGELRLKPENCEFTPTQFPAQSPLDSSLALTVLESTPDNSSLLFTLHSHKAVFQGSLAQKKLGTIQILNQPSYLEATFIARDLDICVTDSEGLWKHDISPNKQGILGRKLAIFWLAKQFQPYLSWIQLGDTDLDDNIPKTTSPQIPETELLEIISQVYQASTDNFLELAKIANLNPLTDLAGGNFLAADLKAIDLNSANLYHINLRGADLTDVDFSEANLSYGKFSGADLSGAFLESANLSYSDLHRASLALANLIGADLTGANLLEANVSNANFSSAKVEKAQFGNNPGMSLATQKSLEERGAIF